MKLDFFKQYSLLVVNFSVLLESKSHEITNDQSLYLKGTITSSRSPYDSFMSAKNYQVSKMYKQNWLSNEHFLIF